jgi:hypothetical protein
LLLKQYQSLIFLHFAIVCVQDILAGLLTKNPLRRLGSGPQVLRLNLTHPPVSINARGMRWHEQARLILLGANVSSTSN